MAYTSEVIRRASQLLERRRTAQARARLKPVHESTRRRFVSLT